MFSFWRVWITAWRNPSTVRPSALSNPGFPSGSNCQAAVLWGSALNARSLYEQHASWKAVNAACRQTSCANSNRSFLKSQPYRRNSQHPAHHVNISQSHTKSSTHLNLNNVSVPSLKTPNSVIHWCNFKGLRQYNLSFQQNTFKFLPKVSWNLRFYCLLLNVDCIMIVEVKIDAKVK